MLFPVLWIRIRDPVPFWPLDPGWVKIQDPNPGSGIGGLNKPDHISKSSETIFWVKNTLMWIRIRGPESFWPWIREGKIRIRDKHPGYVTLGISFVLRSKPVRLLGHRARKAEKATEFVTLKRQLSTVVSIVSLVLHSKPVCLSGGRAVGRRGLRGSFS